MTGDIEAMTCDIEAMHDGLDALRHDIVSCRACPRLVSWRERVATERRAAFRDQQYWGRPVPGFGDADATLLVLGLAPAAHGANRTGRVFTGDRSGDWLFRALHRARLASRATSVSADDGLTLRGCWVSAAVRCAPPANKPLPAERDACLPFLRRELELLASLRAILALGSFAHDLIAGELGLRPRPRFGHGSTAEAEGPHGPVTIVGCYHPSQQNTFTGKLTEAMLDAAVATAAMAAGAGSPRRSSARR